jgi:transcriptional regulator with XRE-family HTH domain
MKTHEKISKRLQDKGQTQKWLADKLGVSEKRVSLWLKGTGRIPPEKLHGIAEWLDLPIEFLADPTLAEPPSPELTFGQRQILALVRALKLDTDTALCRIAHDPGEPPYGQGYTRAISHQKVLPAALREESTEDPNPVDPPGPKKSRKPSTKAKKSRSSR